MKLFKSQREREDDAIVRSLKRSDGTWMNIATWEKVLPKAGPQTEGRSFQGQPIWIDNTLPDGIWEVRKRIGKGQFKVLEQIDTNPQD